VALELRRQLGNESELFWEDDERVVSEGNCRGSANLAKVEMPFRWAEACSWIGNPGVKPASYNDESVSCAS